MCSSLSAISGSKNSKMNRQLDRNKVSHTKKRQTSYINVYKIPIKYKIKLEKQTKKELKMNCNTNVTCWLKALIFT